MNNAVWSKDSLLYFFFCEGNCRKQIIFKTMSLAKEKLGSFLAADEREDLWYSGYILIRAPAVQPTCDQVLLH